MFQQRPLFPVSQTRSYIDALIRHEKRFSVHVRQRRKSDDASREKVSAKEERDLRCQRFFEAMLKPPQRPEP